MSCLSFLTREYLFHLVGFEIILTFYRENEGAGLVQQQPELAAQEFLQSLQTDQTESLGQPASATLFRNRALIKSRVLKCFQVKFI